MRVTTISLAVVSLLLFNANVLHAQNDTKGPCDIPQASQFDFWVGEWDVSANGKVVGFNRITAIHGGCTVFEEYRALSSGFEGKSFNYYDPGDKKWHQVWVDNAGTRLNLAGVFKNGEMSLSGTRMVGGVETVDRITWTDLGDGTVRQHWEQSTDKGATWKTAFDGHYTPAKK